jgi:hypothetical protein
MLQIVDQKTADVLQVLIDHHSTSISYWLRKMGLDTPARKAYWLRLAGSEADSVDWNRGLEKTPPRPAYLVLESGNGMDYKPGLLTWLRPYPIDIDDHQFPYDFPINQRQILELAKTGYACTLLPDGTGFNFVSVLSKSEKKTEAETQVIFDDLFHLSIQLKTRKELTYERDKIAAKNESQSIRNEDAGTGGSETEGS